MKKPLIIIIALIVLLALGFIFYFNSQGSRIFVKDGIAISGYDPVGYFTDQKPVKGNKEFSYNYKNATWYFVNEQNRDAFKANPGKYVPKYGGYCAFGLSRGYKAPTEPDAWSIVNDTLYLNYNTDVRTEWTKNQAEFIKKADANWPAVQDKK